MTSSSQSKTDWAVVGGGFRGIVAAALLRRQGFRVTLVERETHLGGLLYSSEWEGLHIDKGAHLFDNIDDRHTDLVFDIMDEDIVPVDVRYASVMDSGKVDGVSIPDFCDMPASQQEKAVFDLIAAAGTEHQPPNTLKELFQQMFGDTLADKLDGPTRKMLRKAPEEISPEALASTPFARLRFLPDAMTDVLKTSPLLDDRLAIPAGDDPMRPYRGAANRYEHRNFYPARHGMRGFCEHAERYLADIGVELRLGQPLTAVDPDGDGVRLTLDGGEAISAERILWALPSVGLAMIRYGENPLKGWAQPVPMLIYYYLTHEDNIGPYAYMHDFSTDHLLFRPSAIGRFGGARRDDGMTYVCFEAPTDLDSPEWAAPDALADRLWQEGSELDFVTGARPDVWKAVPVPVTYMVPKPGFNRQQDAMMARLDDDFGRSLCALDQHAFAKKDIHDAIDHILN